MLLLRSGVARVRVDELTFSPDGGLLAAPAGAAGVLVWTIPPDRPKSDVLKLPVRSVKQLVFAADGTRLYAGNDELCRVRLPDRGADPIPIRPWSGLWFGVTPDGSRLFVAGTSRGDEWTRLTCWAVGEEVAPVREVRSESHMYSPPLFPPGADWFLFAEANRQPSRQWECRRVRRSASTGEVLDRSVPFVDHPEQTVLSPDGTRLACRTREAIRIYPAAGGWTDVPTVRNDSMKHFTGIAFHPSGGYLAATSNDTTVKLYDTASWQLATTYTWGVGRLRSVAFSPDGSLAAAGSDTGKVVVWDVDL